jgi:hypothetical protein
LRSNDELKMWFILLCKLLKLIEPIEAILDLWLYLLLGHRHDINKPDIDRYFLTKFARLTEIGWFANLLVLKLALIS